MTGLQWFFTELRRRKVVQTFVPYLGFVWLVLQVIAVVTPMLNLSPLVATFVAVCLFALIPVMLYLAWFYDVTSQGLVAVDKAVGGAEQRHSVWWWLILLLIVLLSGWLGMQYYHIVSADFSKRSEGIVAKPMRAQSIVVLPFQDHSSDSQQRYLANGISEELTALLGQVGTLQVASANAARLLSGQNLQPIDIAKRLNVATYLSGSVHSSGNLLKLRVELVDANSSLTLWSQSFSREIADIFQLEAEIGRAIANLLLEQYLAPGELSASSSTRNSEAYLIYLQGRELYRQQTTESVKQARQHFEQALALDPEFAIGYVALADSLILLAEGEMGFGVISADIAATLVTRQLDNALLRAPDLAEAHAVRGLALFYLQQQPDEALAAFDKALSLNASLAQAHLWRFVVLYQLGRPQDAWQALQQAYRLDPVSVLVQYNRGFVLSQFGQIAEATVQFEQLIADFPASPMGYAGLADIKNQQGQLADSIRYWHKASQLSEQNINYKQSFIGSLLELGLTDQVRQLTDDPQYEHTLLLLEGRYSELFSMLDFAIAANPDDGWLKFEAGWYQLLVGDQQTGIDLLLSAEQQLSKEELYALPLCSPAVEIAWAHQQHGANLPAIINRCPDLLNVTDTGTANIYQLYLQARFAALKNQPEQAEAALLQAIQQGWRQWWTARDPLLSEITKRVAVIQALDKMTLAQQQQREQVLTYLAEQASSANSQQPK